MKKTFLAWIIISFFFIHNQVFATTAVVKVTAVRMRENASTDSNIVTNLYQDDEVEILEENGEWYKVKSGEKVGFAKAEFFTKKMQPTSNTTTQNTVSNETKPQNTTTEPPITNSIANEAPKNNITVLDEQVSPIIEVGQNFTLATAVKIRAVPNLSANSKTELPQGTNVIIEANLGNWYKVTNQTISGWATETKLTEKPISEPPPVVPTPEPVQNPTPPEEQTPTVPEQPPEKPQEPETPSTTETPTQNKTAIVIVETARVRKAASKNAGIIDVLDEDDIVTITGEEGDFYKITCSKINSGYISKNLVKQKDVTSRGTAEEREATVKQEITETVSQAPTVTGADIVAFANQYLGYPYVLGCSTPEKGFDCSGFTRYVFGHFGFSLGQVAADQTTLGEVVEKSDLQTGDLILFYNEGKTKIGHCGIFMNGGDFIHSANPQRGVVIDNLNTNSYYAERFVTARRIAGKC